MTTILCDSREQLPLQFTAYPTELAGGDNWEEEGRGPCLSVGDYSIKGFHDWNNPAFIIERKSLSDLCGSLGKGRARFMREVEKMRQFGFAALVIEGEPRDLYGTDWRSGMSPLSIMSTLDALAVRQGLHVCWAGTPHGAAAMVESLVKQFISGIEKDASVVYGVSRTVLQRLVKEYHIKKQGKDTQ